MRHLYLVRHAEARKNVEGRQGGHGSELTREGMAQARRLGAYLAEEESGHGHKAVVCYHAVAQVQETATSIANVLGWPMEQDERLRGLHLGRLAGLTPSEARRADAAAVDRLDRWARGKLRIDQLALPGAEDLGRFRRRVADCLDQVMRSYEHACLILVGTTSTMIMLQNLLVLGAAFSYELYRSYPFANGSVCQWTLLPGSVTQDLPSFVPSTDPRRR